MHSLANSATRGDMSRRPHPGSACAKTALAAHAPAPFAHAARNQHDVTFVECACVWQPTHPAAMAAWARARPASDSVERSAHIEAGPEASTVSAARGTSATVARSQAGGLLTRHRRGAGQGRRWQQSGRVRLNCPAWRWRHRPPRGEPRAGPALHHQPRCACWVRERSKQRAKTIGENHEHKRQTRL